MPYARGYTNPLHKQWHCHSMAASQTYYYPCPEIGLNLGRRSGTHCYINLLVHTHTHTYTISLLSEQAIWSLCPLLLSSYKLLAYKEFILYHAEEEEEILAENTVQWPSNNLHPSSFFLIRSFHLPYGNTMPVPCCCCRIPRAWIRMTSDQKA